VNVDTLTGEPVESYDKGRGYEVGENQFVLVEDSLLMTGCPYRKLNPVGAA